MHRPNQTLRLAPLLAAALSPVVVADIVHLSNGPDQLLVKVTHMPDFDQRRQWDDAGTPGYFGDDIVGLPNNGAMYCVPTAIMNLFVYAANHGFPGLSPGAGSWQAPEDYNIAGLNIYALGQQMDTDPIDGTSGGTEDGANQWLSWSSEFGDLLFLSFRRDGGDYPRAREIADMVRFGGVASFAYGRYEVTGDFAGIPLVSRDGGHCVTLTRYDLNDGEQFIRYRNSESDDSKFFQSPWADMVQPIDDISVISGGFPLGHLATVSAINHPAPDGGIRIIDSAFVLLPRFGLSYQNIVVETPQGPVSIPIQRQTFPVSFDHAEPIVLDQAVDLSGTIVDWAPSPYTTTAWGLIDANDGAGPTLVDLDLVTGETSPLPNAPEGLDLLVAGRRNELFGHNGSKLVRMAHDGTVEAWIALPAVQRLAYDDATDEVLALSVDAHRLFRVGRSLEGPVVEIPIPAGVPMAGQGDLVADPNDSGRIWFVTDASDTVFGAALDGAVVEIETIALPAVQSPTALEVDERGRLYAVCDGVAVALRRAEVGGWEVAFDAAMHGQAAGAGFTIGRSRTNFDPATMSGPEWRNIEGEVALPGSEIVDCIADLNGDGAVDGVDLGVLLSQWGGAGTGDLDHDGAVDGGDLGAMLAAWGACPG